MPSYFITGANRGIGFEFVKQLTADSQNIVFGLVRNISKSADLLALRERRKNLHVAEGDLNKSDTLKAAAADVAKVTGGTLDFLINNASLVSDFGYPMDAHPGGAEQLEAEFVDAFRVNVVGLIHVTNAFLPLIRAASTQSVFTPKVITLGSGIGDIHWIPRTGLDIHAPYTISKSAQAAVMAKYAATFYKENIIFLTISPGVVDTSTEPLTPDQLAGVMKIVASFKRAVPEWGGKPLTPEESVKAMLSVFDKLTMEDNGTFISHKGNQDWL